MAAPDIITSLGTATIELESISARISETQAQFVRSTADVPHLLGVLRSTRVAQLVPAVTLVPAVETQRESGRASVDSRAAALRPVLDALATERQQLEKQQQDAACGLHDAAGERADKLQDQIETEIADLTRQEKELDNALQREAAVQKRANAAIEAIQKRLTAAAAAGDATKAAMGGSKRQRVAEREVQIAALRQELETHQQARAALEEELVAAKAQAQHARLEAPEAAARTGTPGDAKRKRDSDDAMSDDAAMEGSTAVAAAEEVDDAVVLEELLERKRQELAESESRCEKLQAQGEECAAGAQEAWKGMNALLRTLAAGDAAKSKAAQKILAVLRQGATLSAAQAAAGASAADGMALLVQCGTLTKQGTGADAPLALLQG